MRNTPEKPIKVPTVRPSSLRGVLCGWFLLAVLSPAHASDKVPPKEEEPVEEDMVSTGASMLLVVSGEHRRLPIENQTNLQLSVALGVRDEPDDWRPRYYEMLALGQLGFIQPALSGHWRAAMGTRARNRHYAQLGFTSTSDARLSTRRVEQASRYTDIAMEAEAGSGVFPVLRVGLAAGGIARAAGAQTVDRERLIDNGVDLYVGARLRAERPGVTLLTDYNHALYTMEDGDALRQWWSGTLMVGTFVGGYVRYVDRPALWADERERQISVGLGMGLISWL